MAAASFARDLIEQHLDTDGQFFIEGSIKLRVSSERIVNITRVRADYPRAYEPWKRQEDEQLVGMHKAALPTEEISRRLKRQPGAIRTRLQKLGLIKSERSSANRPR